MGQVQIEHLLAARAAAAARGDLGLVQEIDHQLARWGYEPAEAVEDRPVHAPERAVPKRVRTAP